MKYEGENGLQKKSLKGKIAAGTVVVFLVSGAGFAFANTDAGERLKNWYDGMFNVTVEEALDEVEDYGAGQVSGLEEDLENAKDEAAASIFNTRDSETDSSLSEIERAKQAHLEALIEEKGEILGYMEHEFYNVYMENWLELMELADEGVSYASAELALHTGEKGEESLQFVTTELTTATDQAVQDLETEIEKAKQELEAGLDTHQDHLTNNLKKEIDFVVSALQETITTVKDDLVEEQENIITAKAEELEDAAKASLDEVVNGINN